MRTVVHALLMGLAAAILAGPSAGAEPPSDPAARAPIPVQWTVTPMLRSLLTEPLGTPPPGANDWSCKPGAAHPYPVILLHGTGGNMAHNFQTISPSLYNQGYCVFALNYGINDRFPSLPGTALVEKGAADLSVFVDRVLAATGAPKVDLVGHSGGGLIPQYYILKLDGADKVRTKVGLAPGSHPDLYGLPAVEYLKSVLDFLPFGNPLLSAVQNVSPLPYFTEIVDADFWRGMYDNGDSVPQVNYTNIVTRFDEIIQPSAGFMNVGPNVTNLIVQDYCGLDIADHLALAFDPTAMGLIGNALDPAHASPPPCRLVLPVVG